MAPLKPRKRAVVLPEPSPHWHPAGCRCEPAQPYIRVSKIGTREEVISPDLQMRSIEAYARRMDLRLLDPVCDIDRTGRTFRKRSVDAIIEDIRNGKHRRVLLWKWSRWARNQEESAKYLSKVRVVGGRVDSATEDFDQDTAIGRLQMGVLMQFDQYTSDLASEGFRDVHERRRDAGLPHTGRRRFGYTYVNKAYVINDEEAPLVRLAYEAYVSGDTYANILQLFKASGVRTTMDGEWSLQGLIRMMDTGFAAGMIRERTEPTGAPVNSIRSYDRWRTGAHEPLISAELWQKYRARRFAQEALPTRSRRAVHALSALLFCAICKHRLVTRYSGPSRSHQWECMSRKHDASVSVNNKLALSVVREWVRAEFGDELMVREYILAAAEARKQPQPATDDEQARIAASIRQVGRKLERLLDLYEDGDLDKAEYRKRKEAHEQEAARLVALQRPAVAPVVAGVPDYEALRTLDAVWDDLATDPAQFREALSSLVSRIEVGPRSGSAMASAWTAAVDRVRPVGSWELPGLDEWRAA